MTELTPESSHLNSPKNKLLSKLPKPFRKKMVYGRLALSTIIASAASLGGSLTPDASRAANTTSQASGKGLNISDSAGNIQLNWQPGADSALRYRMYRLNLSTNVLAEVSAPNTLAASTDRISDSQPNNDLILYSLFGFNAAGSQVSNSDLLGKWFSTESGLPPKNFALSLSESNQVSLKWEKNDNPSSYLLWRTDQPVQSLAGDLTNYSFPVNGPTCAGLLAERAGNIIGLTNVLCAVPGFANFAAVPDLTPTFTIRPTSTDLVTATRTPTTTPTRTPTSTAIEATITPTRSATSTEVVTPTAVLAPAQINYDVALGVSPRDLQLIQEGISQLRAELQTNLGGDILRPVGSPITVKIISNGTGGGCCFAFDPTSGDINARPSFDVRHQLWLVMNDLDKRIAAGHELTHGSDNALGCLTLNNHLLPDWLEEGKAAYVPHRAQIRNNVLNEQVTRWVHFAAAESTGQLSVPLSSLEHPAPIYPGHVGYIAVDNLVSRAPSGYLSLRTICESVGAGTSLNQAFQNEFGVSMSDFYNQFPSIVQSWRTSDIYLELVRAVHQTPSKTEYEFNFAAFGYEKLTSEQQFASWILPPQMCGWGGESLGKIAIALCDAPAGPYNIGLQLLDGRNKQIVINHTN